jgi:alpha-tubulin suppressor-like RCC1 family protein
VGDNSAGQCNVGGWTGITQVAAGIYHTVGLKSDGTVVAVGSETELTRWNLGVADSEEPPPVNRPLIGGIIALVVVGLVIFFVRRKRAAQTKRFL